MAELDRKDRIILYELDKNARQPLSAIAKKAGMSREAVLYRVRGYQKDGIIRSYLAVIDMAKLGFVHHKVFVRLHNITKKQEEDMISDLCRSHYMTWVASCDGKYSLAFGVKARSFQKLSAILREINRRYWKYFMSQDVASIVEARHFHRDYLIGKSGTTKRKIGWSSQDVQEKIDARDVEILEMLSQNPRASSVEIASAAGISPDTVLKRISALERAGIISNYTIWPNVNKLKGLYYKVLISLHNLDEKNEKLLHAYCLEHPNIVYIVSTIGAWQFEMDVEVENENEFRELMRSFLERFPGMVSDYSPLNVYQEHKFRFFEKAALEG